MKKALVSILGIAMLAAPAFLFAAGEEESMSSGELTEPGVFPVEPGITLQAGWHSGRWGNADENVWAQQWETDTNVTLEFVEMENVEKITIAFSADDYPDLMLGTAGLEKNLISRLLQDGVAVDLRPYLFQGYTPNLDQVFTEKPEALSYMLNPEGKLSNLARFQFQEAHYLEQNFMVNRKWLDALGLDVPMTTDELRDVLIAFRDNDPNGNGDTDDELPFGFVANDGFAQHLRSMYGIWGMATKNGIAIEDGQAYFAPITDGYRDMITYFAGLHSEGLIDPESFTQSAQDFNAKVDDPAGNVYGYVIAVRGYQGTEGRAEFESVPPFSAPGYDPEMWIHPGRLAIKHVWFMTDVNPYPEHTMAWADRLYTLENSVQSMYGIAPEGVKLVDGVWTPQEIPAEARVSIATPGAIPALFRAEDYGVRLAMDASSKLLYDNYYAHYIDYKAAEQWVRPEFTDSEQTEISELRTDINTLWQSNEARWISGVGDIDAEWDAYVEQMKAMRIDRYVELHQAAHTRFTNEIGDYR
ncbi:MAG: extracellular solute-binding protein [Spirochaetaceae bacterium]|nr:extracellular solute-binding protein [Spirochaetaceae bacterium]